MVAETVPFAVPVKVSNLFWVAMNRMALAHGVQGPSQQRKYAAGSTIAMLSDTSRWCCDERDR
jgi:hypothetical protein